MAQRHKRVIVAREKQGIAYRNRVFPVLLLQVNFKYRVGRFPGFFGLVQFYQ